MEKVNAKLTVYFDAPFWVGVYERRSSGMLEASRIVFGAEPKDYEVLEILLHSRLKFSPPVSEAEQKEVRVNPKRMRRMIGRQLAELGTGTKAQQALKLQQQEGKQQRKQSTRVKREEEKQKRYDMKQQKKKEKHKGK